MTSIGWIFRAAQGCWQTWLRWVLLSLAFVALWGRPAIALPSPSPLSGLMALRQLAQESMPYEEAIANQKPTVLEFYADWCSVCQSTAPTLRQLHDVYGADLNFVLLNVDDPHWVEQVQSYQVTGIPQLSLLKADQSLWRTRIGQIPASILSQDFDQLLQE